MVRHINEINNRSHDLEMFQVVETGVKTALSKHKTALTINDSVQNYLKGYHKKEAETIEKRIK